MNETVVRDSTYMIHIDLGSCASVILCGIDARESTWIGVNHLFKARDKNSDMALEHVAELYNSLEGTGAERIECLGLFGAAYREKSMAKAVAQRNIMTTLEALSLFNLSIELFQTGYSQGITVLKSDSRRSFMIMHHNIDKKEKNIIEVPLDHLFR